LIVLETTNKINIAPSILGWNNVLKVSQLGFAPAEYGLKTGPNIAVTDQTIIIKLNTMTIPLKGGISAIPSFKKEDDAKTTNTAAMPNITNQGIIVLIKSKVLPERRETNVMSILTIMSNIGFPPRSLDF
tara:strand:+ start:1373 stop:1762 length:390 start_codon:yes stop_codon:yes gene_type:complete